mmetsp:Transcript_7898/g.24236  ORF Transcript_7898/g.24236 Transcript_7898/m.24236 type:complete len:230 (+) Transcript_7898:599-1288(+)
MARRRDLFPPRGSRRLDLRTGTASGRSSSSDRRACPHRRRRHCSGPRRAHTPLPRATRTARSRSRRRRGRSRGTTYSLGSRGPTRSQRRSPPPPPSAPRVAGRCRKVASSTPGRPRRRARTRERRRTWSPRRAGRRAGQLTGRTSSPACTACPPSFCASRTCRHTCWCRVWAGSRPRHPLARDTMRWSDRRSRCRRGTRSRGTPRRAPPAHHHWAHRPATPHPSRRSAA